MSIEEEFEIFDDVSYADALSEYIKKKYKVNMDEAKQLSINLVKEYPPWEDYKKCNICGIFIFNENDYCEKHQIEIDKIKDKKFTGYNMLIPIQLSMFPKKKLYINAQGYLFLLCKCKPIIFGRIKGDKVLVIVTDK